MSPHTGPFWRPLTPKLVDVVRQGYSVHSLRQDVLSGISVGIVALPLAMAFAIASGVPPERGLFTAIVAGGLISLLSGSRYQIGGPTGAFVVIVSAVVARHGYDGLVLATLMAGAMLLVFALSGLGALIQFIPYPVTTGFTAGIGLIIFSTQLRDFFGLAVDNSGGFVAAWKAYGEGVGTISPAATGLGAGSLILLIALRRLWPRLPGALIVIVTGSVVVSMTGWPIETIGQRFGEIPSMLPSPALPEITLARVRDLLPDAFAIALLAGIESLLSAVVADGMTGDNHRPNAELLAQGFANLGSAVFGGIPATGAIARTATNIRAGACGPVSGLVHAATLLLLMLVAAPLAKAIPLATLAAILILVAWNMSEIDRFLRLFTAPRSDVAVLLTTFLLTVLVDLNAAIEVGVVLAALLFMKRMVDVSAVEPLELGAEDALDENGSLLPTQPQALALPKGVEAYEINGPFFFGVADRLKGILDELETPPEVFILRLRHVPAVDATGLHALSGFLQRCRADGSTLVLSGVRPQPRRALAKCGLDERIGLDNICSDIDQALSRARILLRERGFGHPTDDHDAGEREAVASTAAAEGR